jgi:hypothetical protein
MNSSPYNRARHWHMEGGWHWTFAQLIAAHGERGGHVFVTPEVFVMARPVCMSWDEDQICDPQQVATEPDCWHIWLLAGDASAALRFLPYPLPFVSWHRRHALRFHRFEHVLQRFAR